MNISFKPKSSTPGKATTTCAILASLFSAALVSASAQTIYSTGFEAPAFQAGFPLPGQDGWIAPPPFSPDAAVITAAKKQKQNGQTVRVEGADLVTQDFIEEATDGYYSAIGSYRYSVEYDTGGTQTVRISADVKLDGKATPKSNFFSASITALGVDDFGDPSGIGELAISSDGHVYGSSQQDLVPVFLTSTRVALGAWHNLAIEVDFAARTYSFFVDDEWLGTFDFDPSATSNILRRGSMLTYAAPNTAKHKKADHAANFDNFSIEVVADEEE
jgi:hypothetical protein